MTLSLDLSNIINGAAANAVPVNNAFIDTQTYVNTQVINRDGSIAMTAPLTLSDTAPSAPNHAVRLTDLSGGGALSLPPGLICDFGGVAAPSGWLLCDGSIVEQAAYTQLYAAIGDRYNTGGEGGTQFRVPDFRDKFAVGAGNSYAAGDSGGSLASLPAHTHGTGTIVANISHGHTDSFSIPTGGDHFHAWADTISNMMYRSSSSPTGVEGRITEYSQALSFGRVSSTGPTWNVAAGELSTWGTMGYRTETVSGNTANRTHTHTLNGAVSDYAGTASLSGETASVGETNLSDALPPYLAATKIIRAL